MIMKFNGTKSYSCIVCSISFNSYNGLKYYMKMHTGVHTIPVKFVRKRFSGIIN